MRTKLRSKISLLFLTCALLLAIPAVAAIADNVQNDVIAGGNDTITTASSTTINYRITANNGDGESGCNATAASPATLNINAPSGVTASPTSRTFTSCGTNQGVEFSSSTAGDYEITVSVSDSGAGTYNTNPAKFTLHVTNPPPPPNTPPTLTLPGPLTVQATGPNGAVVTYNATANDAQDGPLNPTCAPPSGATFPLGITQVNCSVTDSADVETTGFFDVTVVDTTAPSIAPHDPVTAEATSADGAVVNYTNPTASDLVDGPVQVTCSPASGSQFSLGSTQVTCTATDAHGNTSTSSFTVTVQDTTAPDLTLPDDITAEATGPNGAEVSFNATAEDLVDGPVNVTCTPASPHTFGLGTTQVECSATDAAGNTSSGTFTVTVEDTTGPELSLPANITTNATSNSQATVTYSASATDLVDGDVDVTCTPPSGNSFPAGTTTVNCSATDNAGNTSNGSFTVTVNFGFDGFRQPVDNQPTLNSVKAGSAVPVKFSLSGNQGLSIFATGINPATNQPYTYPTSKQVACDAAPTDAVEQTVTAGGSTLSYDASIDQYNYVWKTEKGWAGTCRQLVVKLKDGTTIKQANFKLLK